MRYRQMVAALKQNLEESQKRLRQHWSGVDGPWAAPEATDSAGGVQTTSITSGHEQRVQRRGQLGPDRSGEGWPGPPGLSGGARAGSRWCAS